MNRILVLASVILLSACAANRPMHLSSGSFEGTWHGSGVQNHDTSWTIKVTIIGNKYSIDYPSLGCGGKLTLLSSSSTKLEFKETLSYGRSNCTDNGKVGIYRIDSNSVQYRWNNSSGKTGATGTLTREKTHFL